MAHTPPLRSSFFPQRSGSWRPASLTTLIGLSLFLTPALLVAGWSIDDASVNEGNSGLAQLRFTVSLNACLVTFCSINVDTDDDTAVAGSDYITAFAAPVSGFDPNPQQFPFVVAVHGDTVVELTERLNVLLTNPVGATIDDSGGVGEIVNDDAAHFTVADPAPALEDTGGAMVFTVQLVGQVDVNVAVDYITANGSATVTDGDYSPRSGILYFLAPPNPPNDGTVSVTVWSDDKVELDEVFAVSLGGDIQAGGRNVTCLDCAATGTILNDDSASLSITDVEAFEGDSGTSLFTFDVTLDKEVDVGVDVVFETADGTATVADNDYSQAGSTLTFVGAAGEMESIPMVVNGDTTPELDETFFVNLSDISASGRDVTFADSQGQGTILTEEGLCVANDIEVVTGTVTSTQVVEACVRIDCDAAVQTGVTLTLHAPSIVLDHGFVAHAGSTVTMNASLPLSN